MFPRAIAVGACLALCSTAAWAQPPRGGPPGGPPPGGPGGPAMLFISPCGEPFRGAAPVETWFARADANHDGALDRAEFRADAAAFFKVLDVDGDGVITNLEVSRYEHVVAPEILAGAQVGAAEGAARIFLAQFGGGPSGGPDGGPPGGDDDEAPHAHAPGGRSMEGAAPYNLLGEPEPVAASDGDFNGRITAAEFQAAADRRFARLDKDGDGRLTLATLPRTMAQQMGGRGRPGRL